MTDNQKRWIYVIAVIIVPFIFVHILSHSPVPRLLSLLWLFTILPIILFYAIFTADTVHLKNNKNPEADKRFTLLLKIIVAIVGVICVYSFTLPVWIGVFRAYILRQPFITIDDSVNGVSSPAILATGLYLNVNLSNNSSTGYIYWIPTIYNFGNSQYRFTILPGTNLILDVE